MRVGVRTRLNNTIHTSGRQRTRKPATRRPIRTADKYPRRMTNGAPRGGATIRTPKKIPSLIARRNSGSAKSLGLGCARLFPNCLTYREVVVSAKPRRIATNTKNISFTTFLDTEKSSALVPTIPPNRNRSPHHVYRGSRRKATIADCRGGVTPSAIGLGVT